MITLTSDQVAKIEILDKLLASLDVDQLRQIVDSEVVVAKLKGTPTEPHILINLIREHDTMFVDMMDTKNELTSLKMDFQSLLRVLHADVFTPRYNQDFNSLKSKHGIY